LAVSQKAVSALLTPRLGDSLIGPDGTPWLAGLTHGAPRLNPNDLTQVAALPLNSHLRIDPWDDKVFQLDVKPAPLLNPGDKMPFQATPVFFHLQPYQPPVQSASSSASVPAQGTVNPPAQADPNQTQPPAADNTNTNQAQQPTQGTSNPPPQN
jgi:hypothetical protein